LDVESTGEMRKIKSLVFKSDGMTIGYLQETDLEAVKLNNN
jgi:hypothetical protein